MTKYVCFLCQNKIEVDEKDGIVIVYGCSTCREKLVHKINDMIEATSVRLNAVATEGCKIELPRITRKVQLPDMSLYDRGKA